VPVEGCEGEVFVVEEEAAEAGVVVEPLFDVVVGSGEAPD
jgi:hypothetical protein